MIQTSLKISLSAIDEQRFGIRTARASDIGSNDLPTVTEFCRSNDVKLLIARCPTHELPTAQAMEAQGYSLMDTLVYYSHHLANAPIPPIAESLRIRSVQEGEADAISELTATVFEGYQGHYHADWRLDRKKCDEVYASWAYNSCVSRSVADDVLVAEREGKIAGFITLKIHNSEVGEGPLYGVDPSIQGHGIGRNLVIGALRWFEAKGLAKMIISTQITNLSSQKVWVRLGFEPNQSQYTFHKWFD